MEWGLMFRALPLVLRRVRGGSSERLGQARFSLLVPRLALVIGIGLSVAAFAWVRSTVEREAQQRFEAWASEFTVLIQKRIESYNSMLHGVRAFFDASPSVGRLEFHRYVDSLDWPRQYPGLLSLNFARYVPASRKQAFEDSVRHDTSVDPGGYPAFRIFPEGHRREYLVLEYVEPSDAPAARRSMGWDILTISDHNEERRRVMNQARDQNLLLASGKPLRLVSDPSIIMLTARMPVYRHGVALDTVTQRRDAFIGNIGYAIALDEMIRPLFPPAMLRQARVRLHDAGAANEERLVSRDEASLLFDSASLLIRSKTASQLPPWNEHNARFRTALSIDMAGRKWELQFMQLPGKHFTEHLLTWGTLAAGIASSFLVYGLLRSLVSARERALRAVAGIVHDLSQPIAAIATLSANAESFLRKDRWREARANLHMIGDMTERTARLLGQLRSFARDDEDLLLEAVSVREAVDNALLLVEGRARECGLRTEVVCLDTGVRATADAVRLEQVLLNLLRNAMDAMEPMPDKRISIRIDADDEHVFISVRDSGPGLTPEAIAHAFEPFYTTKPPGKGMGLGLSMSLASVRRFGVDMTASNAPGGGAQFDIQLRRADER
jgi:signal transduction histidine kinase